MYPLTKNYEELYLEMNEKLDQLSETPISPQQLSEVSLTLIQEYLVRLKERMIESSFSSQEEEILFFKTIKPQFQSQLIYYSKVLQVILKWPPAGRESVERFLQRQLKKIDYFFQKQTFLYEYQRSNASFLDEQLFVRGKALQADTELCGADLDTTFTTGYDYVVAKIRAYDLLRVYLEGELNKLTQMNPAVARTESTSLAWTASKASLIELLYALQSSGVFNNGKAALNDVAAFIEKVLHINLGNYYRVFQEIRIRKKSRTQFLDMMKERLIQKMDDTDESPHIR